MKSEGFNLEKGQEMYEQFSKDFMLPVMCSEKEHLFFKTNEMFLWMTSVHCVLLPGVTM